MSSSLGGYGGMKQNMGSSLRGNSRGDIIPKGYEKGQLQQYTPEQMDLYKQQFGFLGPESYLSRLANGDEDIFEEMEAPAHRQFQGNLGQLASRFSGMGTGGRKSSGFQNTATAAASNFAQDLASRRGEMQQQAIKDLMGFSNQILGQRPYETDLFEKPQKQPSGWGGLAGAGVGAVGGFFAGGGNPATALKGASLGYNIGSGF